MGEVFAGRYELLDPVGQGATGAVWVVWDHRDEQHRAAKVLRQADAAALLRFVREQSLRVNHQHCLTPRGWAGEDERVLFTMDLVRGGSIDDLVGDFGALPPQWAALLLDQLLQALQAVHAAGLVHRDVKPANLLLEPTGRGRPHLRLGDFGVAVPVTEPRLTRADVVLGTPGYRSPEQLRGSDPDPRQDLWAAGAVLVEMLTGERPPADRRAPTSAEPGDVHPGLWEVARRLTVADPAERPASAAEGRELVAGTGLVVDGVPDDDGRDLEVLEHVRRPDSRVRDAAVAPRRPTTATLGFVAIAVGLAMVVAALLLVTG